MASLPGKMANVFTESSAIGPKPVLEFRAGKMEQVGKMVKPDARKGMLQMWQEDGALKLKWKDRRTGNIEDDIFLFPGEAVWQRVEKCTTGRVYMLRFRGGDRLLFFWMQEPKADKDAEYAEKINRYIKDPNQAARDEGGRGQAPTQPAGGAPGAGAGAGGDGQNQMQHILDQLRQMQGAGMGQMVPPMQQQPGGGHGHVDAAAGQQTRTPDVDLDDLLKQDAVRDAIQRDPAFFEERLKEHFPAGIETSVLEEVRSPQFQQTLQLLSSAAHDPESLKEIVTAFGLPQQFDRKKGGVHQLLDIMMHIKKQKAQLALAKPGAEVRTIPPGKAGKYWGTITEMKDDGSVTVQFKDFGDKTYSKQQWESAAKDFREPEPEPEPAKPTPDPKDGDGDATMN